MEKENVKLYGLTGLEKVRIIINFPFADKFLPKRDLQFIKPIILSLNENFENELKELEKEEQRAKTHGVNNHLSLEELVFLFRNLQTLEERKLFAFFFLAHRRPVKYMKVNFKEYAIENAPKLKPEELEIAGLSKEDVEKIIAMYSKTNGVV